MRKPRKPRTINGSFHGMGSGATGSWGTASPDSTWNWTDIAGSVAAGDTAGSGATYTMGDGTTTGWMPSQYAGMDMWITLNGAGAPDTGVTSWTVDSPSPGLTTWFRINPAAYTSADIGAATQTAAAVGTQISNIGTGISSAAQSIFANIGPILIGLAILFVWRTTSKG